MTLCAFENICIDVLLIFWVLFSRGIHKWPLLWCANDGDFLAAIFKNILTSVEAASSSLVKLYYSVPCVLILPCPSEEHSKVCPVQLQQQVDLQNRAVQGAFHLFSSLFHRVTFSDTYMHTTAYLASRMNAPCSFCTWTYLIEKFD